MSSSYYALLFPLLLGWSSGEMCLFDIPTGRGDLEQRPNKSMITIHAEILVKDIQAVNDVQMSYSVDVL